MQPGEIASEVDEMTEIASGLQTETGPDAARLLNGLAGPEGFAATLFVALSRLAEWLGEALSDEETGGLVSDMAVHIGSMREAADQAAGVFERKHRLWLYG